MIGDYVKYPDINPYNFSCAKIVNVDLETGSIFLSNGMEIVGSNYNWQGYEKITENEYLLWKLTN